MGDQMGIVLLLFVLFQVKHMFADYFLQTPRMLTGRGEYWHRGRAEHAGIHAVGSIIVFLLVGTPIVFTIVICLVEWVVHFNIDWAKARYSDRKGFTPAQPGFWRAAGLDQACHQLTYVAMVWAWIAFVAS